MSNNYTEYDCLELYPIQEDLLTKKMKLKKQVEEYTKCIEKETIWLHTKVNEDYNLNQMKLALDTSNNSHIEQKKRMDETIFEKAKTIQESLQEQKQLEIQMAISKINLKYEQKEKEIPTLVYRQMANERTKIAAIERKINDLENRIKLKKESILSELSIKKSKTLVNAEVEKAIALKQMSELDNELEKINEALKIKRR